MATTLAKAYVQIVPSAKGIKGSISNLMGGEAKSAGQASGSSFGNSFAGTVKNVLITAGIGKAIGAAISEGAGLQQSLGGIETLFKDSADTMKQYANEAYKTTGLSANAYMETVTGFSASLLQSLGGNTGAAAEAANTAMVDMADNANKMGTSMELIQNAYQGFAKQNYTMLDNLKLGYGGTKEEMNRLLADAQKLSGVKYDISNLADVYDAIHVIQGEMGISGRTAEEVAEIYKNTGREVSEQLGTTAKEASTTLSGSLASMKAAFSNVLGNLALGEDIGPSLEALLDTTTVFMTQNLIPMLANIIRGLPQALSGVITVAVEMMNFAKNNAGEIIQMGIDVTGNLVMGLAQGIPALIEAAIGLAVALGNAIVNTDWVTVVNDLLARIKESLAVSSSEILGSDTSIISSLADSITTNLPTILNQGVVIITNLVTGILQSIPAVIEGSGKIITAFIGLIMDNHPTILQSGVKIILNLVTGLINSLPSVISSTLKVISEILGTITKRLPDFLKSGLTIIGELIAGLIKAIPDLVAAVPKIIASIVDTFKEFDWKEIGVSIIDGICNGLSSALGTIVAAVKEVAKQALDAAISFFGGEKESKTTTNSVVGKKFTSGVHSINRMMEDAVEQSENAMRTELQSVIKSGNRHFYGSGITENGENKTGDFNQILNIYSPAEVSPYEVARQTRNATRNMILIMNGGKGK